MTFDRLELNRRFDRWRVAYSEWRKDPTEENHREREAAWVALDEYNEEYWDTIRREAGR